MRVLASETAVWEAVRDLPLDALFPMRAGSCVLEGGSAVRAGATLRVDCLDGTAWRCAVEDRDQDRRRISWTERPLEGAEDPSAAMRWFAIAVTAPQVRPGLLAARCAAPTLPVARAGRAKRVGR